ncbi:MAG: hypothetical protein P1U40_02485 [Coxiellaceae bacterium]|nr:hypothetical protein [Coxiellaceae bacterium]
MNITINAKNTAFVIVATSLMCLASYMLNTHTFLYWDVAWHVEGAARVLNGGRYLSNLADDNPPMVFFYYLPLAYFCKAIGILSTEATHTYIYALYIACFSVIYCVLKNNELSTLKINIIYLTAISLTLFLGVNYIGQRELNMLCFFTPYLLLNLFNKKPSRLTGLASASLAAIGIMQAPFYLLLPVIIDTYNNLIEHSQIRLTQIIFYCLCVFLLLVSYLLYPHYFDTIIPLVYFAQHALNTMYTQMILFNPILWPCIVALLLLPLLLIKTTAKYNAIKCILLIVCAILIYLLEHKIWFYHLLPVIYLSVISFAFLATQNISDSFVKKTIIYTPIILLLFTFLLITIPQYIKNRQQFADSQSQINQLIRFTHTISNKNAKLLILTTRVTPTYEVQLHTGIHVISPWANDWILPSLVATNSQVNTKELNKLQRLYTTLILNALKQAPQYIIYYASHPMPYIRKKEFDYYNFLYQNPSFTYILKNYIKTGEIGRFSLLTRRVNYSS